MRPRSSRVVVSWAVSDCWEPHLLFPQVPIREVLMALSPPCGAPVPWAVFQIVRPLTLEQEAD